MPRMSQADKQKSHARIVDAAAQLLREKGIGATSVGDVMKAAGMTHGGFYRHFESKDDLVASAFSHTVDDVVREMEAASTPSQRRAARQAYIERYLSAAHVANRGGGCPLAALGAGLVRVDGPARHSASCTVERMARLLDAPETERHGKGRAIMALMAGTLVLARLAEKEDDMSGMLEAGKTAVELLEAHWKE